MTTIARSRTALLALTGASFVGILAGCSSTAGGAAAGGDSGASTGSSASSAGDSSSAGASSSAAATDTGSSSAAGPASGTYKNGTYTEKGTYSSPGGQEVISVTLTIGSDAVSDVSVKTVTADPTATQYEAKFIGGIHSAIVGKKIDELNVTRVAGSSLTSQGFDDALAKIKTDAKA